MDELRPSSGTVEPFWSESRTELHGWLVRHALPLADLYEGALRMVHDVHFPGRTRFVAHAVREIRNRLPQAISGQKGSGRLDYVSRFDSLVMKWERAGLPTNGSYPVAVTEPGSIGPGGQMLPPVVYRDVAALIKDHIETREKPKEATFRLLRAIDPENGHVSEQLIPVIANWLDITSWSVENVHESLASKSSSDELTERFESFETFLRGMIQGFFKTTDEIDEILEETNS